jgi:hypothetical protein
MNGIANILVWVVVTQRPETKDIEEPPGMGGSSISGL